MARRVAAQRRTTGVAELRSATRRRRYRSRRRSFDQPAAGRVRRGCGRAALRQHAGLVRASVLRMHPRASRLGPLFRSAGRPPSAVRLVRRARLACRRIELERTFRMQRLLDRNRALGAGRRSVRSVAVRVPRTRRARLRAPLSDRRRGRARARRAWSQGGSGSRIRMGPDAAAAAYANTALGHLSQVPATASWSLSARRCTPAKREKISVSRRYR